MNKYTGHIHKYIEKHTRRNKINMRKYTNSEGMVVEVDDDHLQTAVELKLELQKVNFRSVCNWNKHKKMMEASGYSDSDNNETYRCLVKRYQKDTGQLRSVAKYADYVAESKLEAIKQEVGHLKSVQLNVREDNLKKSKLDRELSYKVMAVEEFREICLDNMDISIPHYALQPRLEKKGNVIAVNLSDWHIGAEVDCPNNIFNLAVAETRIIDKFVNEILDYAKLFKAARLDVNLLGDMIEQFYMRTQQSDECEFGTSRQIYEATELLFKVIVALSEYYDVDIRACRGNHDRMEGNKHNSIGDDHAVYTIMKNLDLLCQTAKIKRVKFHHGDDSYKFFSYEVNGKKVRGQHGDDDSINDGLKIEKYNGIDEDVYDVLIFGHLHHFDTRQGNKDRQTVYCSGLIGTNDYSRDKVKSAANAGQTLILFREDGQVIPINIDLQE